jgi:anti-sigma factor RsiW
MEHDQAAGKLSEYRDRALPAPERDAVARHLAGCAGCAATLRDWERLAQAFLRRPDAPTAFQTEAFAARVMSRLRADEPFAWLTGRWLFPALGAGFTALALSFLPYARAESALDPAAALIPAGAERSAATSPAADVLGLTMEDR